MESLETYREVHSEWPHIHELRGDVIDQLELAQRRRELLRGLGINRLMHQSVANEEIRETIDLMYDDQLDELRQVTEQMIGGEHVEVG